MFLEEIQRTIQQRHLQSGSHKQLVLDKVPESVFLAWIVQQYKLLSELKIASGESHSSNSPALTDKLWQQNLVHGVKLSNFFDKYNMQGLLGLPSVCCSHTKLSCLLKAADISKNMCYVKQSKTLQWNGHSYIRDVPVSSAFAQIPETSCNLQKHKTCNMNQCPSYPDRPFSVNKESSRVSTEYHFNESNIDLNIFSSSVHTSGDCNDSDSSSTVPHLSLPIIPQPRRLVSSANKKTAMESRNNTNCHPVPHIPETVSLKTHETVTRSSESLAANTSQLSSTLSCDCNSQYNLPLSRDQSAVERYSSLSLFPNFHSSGNSFHSLISSYSMQINEERLDEECNLYMFDQIEPHVQRNLENPVAKLLSGGDDMHFIPIEEEMMMLEGGSC